MENNTIYKAIEAEAYYFMCGIMFFSKSLNLPYDLLHGIITVGVSGGWMNERTNEQSHYHGPEHN